MLPFKIVFEDETLMVLDKFPGVVVDPSVTQQTGTLAQILIENFGITLERGGIVHRLDKDTSGLMVVAKTQNALENLQAQFKDRSVKKTYVAACHGFLEPEEIRVEGAIGRNPRDRERFAVIEGGKEAVTVFKLKEKRVLTDEKIGELFPDFSKIQLKKLQNLNYSQYSLIDCFPETGRTHQIRVHLKYINHPLIADERYGGRKTVRLDKRWCKRQFLHASKLEFDHPESGERLVFESELSDDLKQALGCLVVSS